MSNESRQKEGRSWTCCNSGAASLYCAAKNVACTVDASTKGFASLEASHSFADWGDCPLADVA